MFEPVSEEARMPSETAESEKPAEISILNEGLKTEEEHVGQHTMETSLQSPVDQEPSGSKSLETGNVDESLPQPNVLGGEHARDQQVPAAIDPPEAPLSPSNLTENLQEQSPAQIEAVEEPLAFLPVVGEETQSSSVSNQPVSDESREMALPQPESGSKKGKNKKRQDTSDSIDTPVATDIIEEAAPQTTPLEASINEEPLSVSDVQENPAEGSAELAEPAGDDLWSESTGAAKSKKGKNKLQDSDTVGLANEAEAPKAEEPLAEPESQSSAEIVQEPLLERVEPKTGEDIVPEVDSSGSKSEKDQQNIDVSTIGDERESSKSVDGLAPEEQPTQESEIVETGAQSTQSVADSTIPITSQADTIAGDELEKTPVPEAEPPLSKKQKKKNKKKRGSMQIEPVSGDVPQETPENIDAQGKANDEAAPPATTPATDVGTIASDAQVNQVQDASGDILSTHKESRSRDGEEQQTHSRVDTEEITVSPVVASEISAEPNAISEETRQPETEDLDTGLTSPSTKKSKKKKKKRQSVQLPEPAEQGQPETPAEEIADSIPASDANMAFNTDWASADIPPPPAFWSELKYQPDNTPASVDDFLKTEIDPFQDRHEDQVDLLPQNIEAKEKSEISTSEGSKVESQDINVSTVEEPSVQKDAEVLGVDVNQVKAQPLTETLPKNEVDGFQPSSSASEVVSTKQQDIGDQKPVETVAVQEPATQGESQVDSILSDQDIPTQDTLPTQYTLPTETSIAEIPLPKDEIDSIQPSSDEVVAAEQQVVDEEKPTETVVEQGPAVQGEYIPEQDSITESSVPKDGIEQPAESHAESDIKATPQADESIPVAPIRVEDDQSRDPLESIVPSDSQAEPSSSTQDVAPTPAEDELPVTTKKSKKDKKKRKSKTQDTLDATTGIVAPTTEPSAEILPSEQSEIPSTTSQGQTESAQIVPDVPITTEPEEFAPQPQEDDSQNVATKKNKKDKKKKKKASQVQEAEPEPELSALPTEEPVVEQPQSPVRDSSQQNVELSDLPPAQETEAQQPLTEKELSSQPEVPVTETIEATADVPAPVLTIPEPESQEPASVTQPQGAEPEPVVQTEKAGTDMPLVEAEPDIRLSGDAIVSRDGKETQQVAEIPESSVPEKELVAEPPASEKERSEIPATPKSKKDKKKKKKRGSQATVDDMLSAPSQDASEPVADVRTPGGEAASSGEGAVPIVSEDAPLSIPEKSESVDSATITSEPKPEPQRSVEPELEPHTTSQPTELPTESGHSDSPPTITGDIVPADEGLPAEPSETLAKSTEIAEEQVVREPLPELNVPISETVPSDNIAATSIPGEPITESATQPEAISRMVEEQTKDITPSISPEEQESATRAQEPVRPDKKLSDGSQTIASGELAQSMQPGEPPKSEELSQPTEPPQLEESLRPEEQEQEQVPASKPEKLQETLQSQELARIEEPSETGEPLKTEASVKPEESTQPVEEPSTVLDEPELTPTKKSKKDKKKKKRTSQIESESQPEVVSVPEEPAKQPLSEQPSESQQVDNQQIAEDSTAIASDAAKPEDVVPEVSTSKKSKKKKRASQIEPESGPTTPSETQAQQVLLDEPLVQEPSQPSEGQPQVEESLPIKVEENPEEIPPESSSKKSKKERRKAKQLAALAAEPEPKRDLNVENEPATEVVSSHIEQPAEPLNPISEAKTVPSTTPAKFLGKKLQAPTVAAESSNQTSVDETTSTTENAIPTASEDVPLPVPEVGSEHMESAPVTAEQESSEPVHDVDFTKDQGESTMTIDQGQSLPIPEQDIALPQTENLADDTPIVNIADTITEVGQDQADASPSLLPKDPEKEGKETQVPSIPDLSAQEAPNVGSQPQYLPDNKKRDETALSREPAMAEEQLQKTPKDTAESSQTPGISSIEPQEQLPTEQQAEPEASLPEEPEPVSSPISRKKSKKDKKKKRASAQAESESASGTQMSSNQEIIPSGTSNETIAGEPKTLEPERTIANEGEWPESPMKSKKDKKNKKRRKATGTSTPMESMEAAPANAPSETVTQENAPGRLTLEVISEVDGQSSISKDLDIPPQPEGQEQNAEDVNISHPIRETVAVSENVDLASPAAEERSAQLDERPTNETAQEIPSQVEVSVPVSRPRTPTTVQHAISVDLSPAQLSSHVEHDRPFDQSSQPGKKARTHLSSDDATIPEPLSAQADVLLRDPESSGREVSEPLQFAEDRMLGIEVSDAVPQDITPTREIAASYLESHPVSTDDKDATVEENKSIEHTSNAGLLPVITPQREIAASYLEGHSTSEIQIGDNRIEDNPPEEVSDTPMTAHDGIPASHTELQSIQPEPKHGEGKTAPIQHEEVRQPSPIPSPSAREIAADIMEPRPKSSGKERETAKHVESRTTGAIPDALEIGGALLAGKSTSSRKGEKGQKSIDKRTPDTDDMLDNPALSEDSERNTVEEGARLDANAGNFWTGLSTEAGESGKAATPEPMVVESPENLQSQDSVTENAESPVVGREVKRDLPEPRDAGHGSPTSREPPASEIIKKLDDLDTSEHANETLEPTEHHKIDDKSLKSLSPRPDYSSSGRGSPRVLPPVEEETHEELQKEQQSQVRDVSDKASIITGPITVPNRDSGFSSDSPHPKRRSFVDPSLRDSGVHLRDWPESTPKREDELPEEEPSAIRTPQPNERRGKKLGLGNETPKLETPVTRSLEDEAKTTTDPKKPLSSKYGEVGQRSVSDNLSRSSTPRTESQLRRSASNTSISRLRTPEPLQFRPNSPGRSSFRPGTNTPPLSLRRVDKRMSGDLRSLSSNLSNNSASRENLHQSQQQSTPVANEGRVRTKDMTDVYVSHLSIFIYSLPLSIGSGKGK
ncbi:hypothetical protein F5Y06DRAFT_165018 [Hypoxylon sp. FL0890]|nr:hypothetical protein F5Y06DRAFT_165018 [Hypoxylon sp. FL0890]